MVLFFLVLTQINLKAQQDPVDLYATNSIEATGNIGTIEIKANNFTDIISFQASINWDPALLVFVGVSDFGITDFNENNFGTTTSSEGHVRFVWEPSDATAITLDDSTVIFTAQFEFISNQPQEVPVGFTDIISEPAFPIEFANSSFEILTVNTHDGSITFFDEITGLENMYNAGISIYPNPFKEYIRITNEDGELDFVKVFNIHGVLLQEFSNIKDKFIDLQLSGSSNGIYLMKIKTHKGVVTKKIKIVK